MFFRPALYFIKIKYSVLHRHKFSRGGRRAAFYTGSCFFFFSFFFLRLKELNPRGDFFRASYPEHFIYIIFLHIHFVTFYFYISLRTTFREFLAPLLQIYKILRSNRQFLFCRPRNNLYCSRQRVLHSSKQFWISFHRVTTNKHLWNKTFSDIWSFSRSWYYSSTLDFDEQSSSKDFSNILNVLERTISFFI